MLKRKWPVWLDSGDVYRHDEAAQSSNRPNTQNDSRYDILACDPVVTLTTKGSLTNIQGADTSIVSSRNPLVLLREQLAEQQTPQDDLDNLPFVGGALGYFSYDLHRRFIATPRVAKDDLELPEMMMGIYKRFVIVDRLEKAVWLVSQDHNAEEARQARLWKQRLLEASASANPPPPPSRTSVKPSITKEQYLSAFGRLQKYIHDGDCYQANLTQRFDAATPESGWDLFRRQRSINPAPFSAYLKLDTLEILSSSPERFLSLRKGTVETKPIKGTRPRSDNTEEDKAQEKALINSTKDRAENLMIVDLLRNDLGRVCTPGSIHCPELFAVESFATVHHLVSTIRGTLAEGEDALSLLEACFPGGSITGAPKIRAMEIIEELEPVRRGVYCGAIGYIGFDGAMDTNIVIRTITLKDGVATFSSGGGIVADSEAEDEYQESLLKAKALHALFLGDAPEP